MNVLQKFFRDSDELGFRQEWRDLMRGVAGGMIFGTPLLYTMEMWFEGQIFTTNLLTVVLFAVLILNILFSYLVGLREKHRTRLLVAVVDGVSSLGMGVVLSAGVLILLKRISLSDDLNASLGKVLLEACVVSIGVTFTNLKFKERKFEGSGRSIGQSHLLATSAPKRQLRKDLNDIIAAMVGAFIFSFNVAPTEEVVFIASELSGLDQLLLLCFELIICYIILYSSGLKQHRIYHGDRFFQGSINELLLTTSASLIVSFLLLITIGHNGMGPSSADLVSSLIVLGLPAIIGGAAGRLVV